MTLPTMTERTRSADAKKREENPASRWTESLLVEILSCQHQPTAASEPIPPSQEDTPSTRPRVDEFWAAHIVDRSMPHYGRVGEAALTDPHPPSALPPAPAAAVGVSEPAGTLGGGIGGADSSNQSTRICPRWLTVLRNSFFMDCRTPRRGSIESTGVFRNTFCVNGVTWLPLMISYRSSMSTKGRCVFFNVHFFFSRDMILGRGSDVRRQARELMRAICFLSTTTHQKVVASSRNST